MQRPSLLTWSTHEKNFPSHLKEPIVWHTHLTHLQNIWKELFFTLEKKFLHFNDKFFYTSPKKIKFSK